MCVYIYIYIICYGFPTCRISHSEGMKKRLELSHDSWGPTGPILFIFLSNEFSQIVP